MIISGLSFVEHFAAVLEFPIGSLAACIIIGHLVLTAYRDKGVSAFLHVLMPGGIVCAIMFIETTYCALTHSKPGGIYWSLLGLLLLYMVVALIIIWAKVRRKWRLQGVMLHASALFTRSAAGRQAPLPSPFGSRRRGRHRRSRRRGRGGSAGCR